MYQQPQPLSQQRSWNPANNNYQQQQKANHGRCWLNQPKEGAKCDVTVSMSIKLESILELAHAIQSGMIQPDKHGCTSLKAYLNMNEPGASSLAGGNIYIPALQAQQQPQWGPPPQQQWGPPPQHMQQAPQQWGPPPQQQQPQWGPPPQQQQPQWGPPPQQQQQQWGPPPQQQPPQQYQL